MLLITLLSIINFSLNAKITTIQSIPDGKIIKEDLYWRSFNSYISEQEESLELQSDLAIAKETLKNILIKEKMYLKLDHVGSIAKSELENIVLKKKLEKINLRTLKYSINSSMDNLAIHKARMESALQKGFKGNINQYIKNKNSLIHNSKCQERYLTIYKHRIGYTQAKTDYDRMNRLYSISSTSISYERLIDQRLKVASEAIKARAWLKISKNCLASNINPINLSLKLITDLTHIEVPLIPSKKQ